LPSKSLSIIVLHPKCLIEFLYGIDLKEQLRSKEFLVAVLISLWITALHILNLLHAGPLWRDEAGTVDFAAMPTLGDIWRNLRYDNFPPLFVAVARLWTLVGLDSDFSYRLLGFLVGMGTVGLLWYCARKMCGRPPLLVLALYAVNPMAIRAVDSLRPYGLGIALVLLTSALIWNFVQNPGRWTLFWAALAATLSVQCLYQSALFVIAFCCGAWVVTVGRREWKTALQTGIIGLVAALSLLPYWGIVTKGPASLGIWRDEVHFYAIFKALCITLQGSGGWLAPVWLALVAAGLAAAVFCGTRQRRWLMYYCGTVLVVGATLYLVFLREMGLPPRFWYFPLLMAAAALMVDSILGGIDMRRVQTARTLVSVILAVASMRVCYARVHLRQTNIDLVAAELKQEARPKDLIIVCEWFHGISLQRYLDASLWTTLPPLETIRIHRDDLVENAMRAENPIGPLLDKARETLASGHSLWVVGALPQAPIDRPPPSLPPYRGNTPKAEITYCMLWKVQLGYLVEKHATDFSRVEIPVPGGFPVNPFEDVPLLVIHGWRE
jgi:hypothetical protein